MREGWRELTLDEVCDLVKRGIAPKYIESGGICVINQKCIRDHRVNLKLSRRHNIEIKSVNPERYIKFGDVLVNSTGTGTLGRVAQVRDEPNELTTVDTHVTIVRPLEGLFHHEFFGYMMIKIEDEIASSGEGASGQTELSRTKLAKEFKVSFPASINEQKCIVSTLDKAFEGVDKAIANTEKNLANARELFESYLNAVFTQKGEGWVEMKLDEACIVERGSSPRPIKAYLTTETDGVNWVKIGDTKGITKYVTSTKQKITAEGALRSRAVNSGDFILTNSMSYGRPYIMATSGYVHDGWFILRLNDDIDVDFFYHLLTSEVVQEQFRSLAAGAIVKNISGDLVKRTILSIPSKDKQIEIVEIVERLSKETKRLETLYQQKLNALKELKQSLLQKAFSGELTSENKVVAFPGSKIAKNADPFSPEFAAKILAFAYHRHAAKKRHNTFGRVKAQKTLHLVESIAGVDLDRHPIKDAAGPNDFPHMLKAEKWAKEQQFFEFISRGEGKGYDFKKLARYDELMVGLFATLKPYQQRLEQVVDLIIPKDSRETELLATVHAAWNNLILEGCDITDEGIIREARENWHADKLEIPVAEFQQALRFIRKKGVVPDGKAKRVGGQESLF